MPVPEWNAEIITPESESGMPPLATNGGLGTNAQDELEVKVDGSTITVNGDGELEALGGGGSVTDVEVNGTSVVNASGVAEVTVPSGAQLVPAATSADADKVLTVDAQGIPGWETPSGGTEEVFIAKYNTTTWTAVLEAYNAGKVIFLEVTDDSIPYPSRIDSTAQIPLAAIRTGFIGKCAVFIGSSLGSTNGTGENTSWNVYILSSNNTWTTQARKIYPSFTSSDFNKVLSIVDNGNNFPVLQWTTPQGGSYTAGNMISLANDAIAVSTTAGITDVQQVASLPASPVSTVLYLIPET